MLSFFAEFKGHIAAVILLMLAGSALNLVSPYINGRILFDEVLSLAAEYEGRILEVIPVMAGFALASLLLSIFHAGST